MSSVRAVVTLVGILAPVPVLAQGRQSSDWKRIETVDLVVAGNASEGELRRSAANLEQFRGVLHQVFPRETQAQAVPTTLVLLKSDSAFARFRPRDERGKPRNVSGYFTAGPDVAYMVLAAGGAVEPRRHSIPRSQLAAALRAAGRHDDALVASRTALQQNGRSAAAWFGISLSSLALGRAQDAERAFANAVALDPDPDWYRLRAYAAFAGAQDALVVKDAAAYLARAGESETAVYVAFLGALSHRRLGQLPAFFEGRSSGAQLMSAASTDGERTEARTYIGILASMAGERAAAIEHLRWVKERGSRNFVEYPIAVAELERLERGPRGAGGG